MITASGKVRTASKICYLITGSRMNLVRRARPERSPRRFSPQDEWVRSPRAGSSYFPLSPREVGIGIRGLQHLPLGSPGVHVSLSAWVFRDRDSHHMCDLAVGCPGGRWLDKMFYCMDKPLGVQGVYSSSSFYLKGIHSSGSIAGRISCDGGACWDLYSR